MAKKKVLANPLLQQYQRMRAERRKIEVQETHKKSGFRDSATKMDAMDHTVRGPKAPPKRSR